MLVVVGFAVGALATAFADLLSRLVDSIDDVSSPGWFDSVIAVGGGQSTLTSLLFELPITRTPAGAIFFCAALAVIIASAAYITSRVRATISADIYERLRREAFDRCLDGRVRVDEMVEENHDLDGPVNLATALNRGADAVSNTYAYLLNSSQQVISLATALLTTGASNFPVTAACVLVVLLQVFIANVQARRLRERRITFDKELNALQARTADLLSSRELLLAFDKADFYKEDLRAQVAKVASLQKRNETSEGAYSAAYELIEKWGQLAVITAIVALVIFFNMATNQGSNSPLVFALTLYSTLLPSARTLIAAYDAMKRTEAVVASFLRLVVSSPSVATHQRSTGWCVGQAIEFEEVGFSYGSSERVLFQNLSVTIPSKGTTLLLGPSGCGKTTLGRMVLGFLRPQSGRLLIGGRNIEEWSLPYLHEFMSYGPQSDHIIDATVAENLRLAEGGARLSDEKLMHALDAVRLRLGEGSRRLTLLAKELSGGEVQRLSAARILLDQAEIVVLDEPMAGVDVFTLADIAPAVEQHWRTNRQTVLLVSHKLVFGTLASWIVVLDSNGKVAEHGSPSELLEKGGEYVRLRAEALRQAGAGPAASQPPLGNPA